MTLAQMEARLSALLDMRYRGVRSSSFEGGSVTYASDAELQAAITDLERRIAAASGQRRRVFRAHAVKDL